MNTPMYNKTQRFYIDLSEEISQLTGPFFLENLALCVDFSPFWQSHISCPQVDKPGIARPCYMELLNAMLKA